MKKTETRMSWTSVDWDFILCKAYEYIISAILMVKKKNNKHSTVRQRYYARSLHIEYHDRKFFFFLFFQMKYSW